jgi:hypothetical protein
MINSLEIDLNGVSSETLNRPFDLLTGAREDDSLNFKEIIDVAAPISPGNEFAELNINPLDIYYDEEFYLTNNPDVVRVISNGLYRNGFDHLIRTGLFQGRNPSPLYNEAGYLTENPDVAAAVARGEIRSGFEHFLNFGFDEGRNGGVSQ